MSPLAIGLDSPITMPTAKVRAFTANEWLPDDLFGRYKAIAALGSGGMADVYLAVARGIEGFNKLAVVKRLRASEPEQVRLFLDEARLAARLAHPNIVHTYDVGESRGGYFIAMEYLEGQSLEKVAQRFQARGEAFPEPLAAQVMVMLLRALHYTHELRDYDNTPLHCVHRDVSPQNIFVTYGGEVKLLDFGIAKAALNTTVTELGELKGKIRYMSPEQVGGEAMDRRADLYAAGIVFWELLARRGLYEGDAMAVMNRIANTEPARVSSVRRECDPRLDNVAAHALRLDRDLRYATADAMRVDLDAYLRERAPDMGAGELSDAMMRLFAEARAEEHAQVQAFLAGEPVGDSDRFQTSTTVERSGTRVRSADAELSASSSVTAAGRAPGQLLGAIVLLGVAVVVALLVLRRDLPVAAATVPSASTMPAIHVEPPSIENVDGQGIERTVELRPRASAPVPGVVAAPPAGSTGLPAGSTRVGRGGAGTRSPRARPQPSTGPSTRALHIRIVDDQENP
jgi:serine/threonine protein kinase